MMFKLVFNTLVGLFLVMLIMGREDGTAPVQQLAAATPAAAADIPAPSNQPGTLNQLDRPKADNAVLRAKSQGYATYASASSDMPAPTTLAGTPVAGAERSPRVTQPAPAKESPPKVVISRVQFGQEARYPTPAQLAQLHGDDIWQVTAGTLNVRSGPGTGHARVGGLSRNEQVYLLREQNGWAKVLDEKAGTQGWVSKKFLTQRD
ncbi:SH3 domain-containing protein [Rhodobacteraceae bacterium]|nr:SH3 domain-containing protein [Paracoccaceae bacterium]